MPYKTITEFEATGTNWASNTRFVQFSWDDIISTYENAPYPQSLLKNLPKFLAFIMDGSLYRYSKASMRYWGFTVYPIFLMLLFAIISTLIATQITAYFALHWIATLGLSLVFFIILCRMPGDFVYVNLSVNDWAFARDMCNRSNPAIEKRYEQFAAELTNEITAHNYDEIIVVGHSFGAVWATATLAQALDKTPQLLINKKLTFLALGSSLLKIALVKRASFFIDYIKRVTSEKNLF